MVSNMKTYLLRISFFLVAAFLSGCIEETVKYTGDPNTVIATNYDTRDDTVSIANGEGAIVYDPDGCQAWMLDDGVEGYAGRRFDPKSGLPVCNKHFPPGTVIGNYQTATPGIPDYVPAKR